MVMNGSRGPVGSGAQRTTLSDCRGNEVYLNNLTTDLYSVTSVSLSRPRFQGDINLPPPGLGCDPLVHQYSMSSLTSPESLAARRLHPWAPGATEHKVG